MLAVGDRPQPSTLAIRLLNQSNLRGFRALISSLFFKLDFVVLLERLETLAFDGRVVDEYIFAPVRWADESEPLRAVEPLYGTLHNYNIFNPAQRNQAELKQTFAS